MPPSQSGLPHLPQRGRRAAPTPGQSQCLPSHATEASSPSFQHQLTALTTQISELLEEIRQLRKENFDLRRQVEMTRGLHQHNPYPTQPQRSHGLLPRPEAALTERGMQPTPSPLLGLNLNEDDPMNGVADNSRAPTTDALAPSGRAAEGAGNHDF